MTTHIEQKFCDECAKWYPRAEFYCFPSRPNWTPNKCKKCYRREARNKYYDENNQKIRRRWRENNPERIAASALKSSLKRRYQMTIEAYIAMLQLQFYKCAVCGEKFNPESKMSKIHVDHDHTTGKVRGLLCGRCNLVAGYAKDDIERLRKMIEYLQQ